jgi:hypothetical protein
VSGEPCEIGLENRYRSRTACEAEEETDAFIRSQRDRPRACPSADALYEVKGPRLCALGDIAKTLRLAASRGGEEVSVDRRARDRRRPPGSRFASREVDVEQYECQRSLLFCGSDH